jgi:replicative DNA helicase
VTLAFAWNDASAGLRPGHLSPITVQAAGEDLLRYSKEEHSRFGTGWSIDDSCGMVGAGELALWVARSGSGKSTTYLNIIRNTPDVPTVVVNMEMTARRQIEWLLAMTYDLETPSRDIEEVLRMGEEDSRHTEVVQGLDMLGVKYPNLHFVTPVRPTVSDLRSVLEDIEDQTGIRPVRMFVDHLGLMGGAEEGYQGTVRAASGLHSMAMTEDIAVFVLQQTGRSDGNGGRNDGHLPLTITSGLYGGEADADWVLGMYRPERNPKYKKSRYQFENPNDWYQMLEDRKLVEGITILQVLKNRPMGDLCEDGIELRYSRHSRRLEELGVY